MKPMVVALIGIVALGQWGCALRIGKPSLEQLRERVGVVGVAAAPGTPKPSLTPPSSGKGGAAARGAGAGLVAGAQPGVAILGVMSGCRGGGAIGAVICGTVALAGVGIAAAGGTLGALTGALHGVANTEVPSKEIGETLHSTAETLSLADALVESVLHDGPRQTGLTFVPVEPAVLAADRKRGPTPSSAAETYLEVTPRTIRLTREGAGANPPVTLVITARARLLRAADGQELYRHAVTHRSETRPYEEWAADDGQRFKDAFTTASAEMAKEIIDVLFVRTEPPPVAVTPEPWSPPGAAPGAPNQPPLSSWAPARSTAEAMKQYACQRQHLSGFSDWRDRLPAYRACLAQ